MTNKIIPIAVILVVVVIVAALALTQTNPNTTVASSNDSMNMSNGDMGNNGNVSNGVGANTTVLIENGTFNPANLTVKAGTTVIWTVKDNSDTKYMVTSDANGSVEGKYLFMSDDLTNGQSFRYTFNKTGTYGYYDMDHMDDKKLTGTIIVQ
jgi:Plastocyanin